MTLFIGVVPYAYLDERSRKQAARNSSICGSRWFCLIVVRPPQLPHRESTCGKPPAKNPTLVKTELIALFGQQFVDRANIAAQVVLLLCAAVGFYEARARRLLKTVLERVAHLQKYIWFGRWGVGIGTPQPTHGEEFSRRVYFLASSIIVAAVVLSERGLGYWALYPLRQFANAVLVWGEVSLSDWSSILVPIKSGLFFIWGILLLVTVYPGGFGIPIKSALIIADWLSRRFSETALHFALFFMTVVAGIVVIATSADWTG